MRSAFPTFTDSSVVVEKNNANYLDDAKFASFVQKIALRLKDIAFILQFHSESSSTTNLIPRKLETQELISCEETRFS